jgi:hypothetical protein
MRALLNGEALATEANVTAAWIDFLYAFNGVYQKLQKGSLLNGKSKAWFGRIKHMRDSDELLSYLHQARNAEEHGLEAITKTEFNTPVLAGTDEKDRANWPKGTIYIPLTLSPGQKAYSRGAKSPASVPQSGARSNW